MTEKEAIEVLKDANRSDNYSKVNPSLTCKQVVEIIEKGFDKSSDKPISDLFEKRVYQALRNQRRPRYKRK